MKRKSTNIFAISILNLLILNIFLLYPNYASAREKEEKDMFTVVLDPGHGGKDHGALDNNAKEKDINLAVALKVGELCKKKLKNTKIVFTRDDDNFISLQGRADVANKAKANLFISIHTNSVDAKNKSRRSVSGATVYTQGPHKDEANLGVARRENSVIEMENGYEQRYAGFDPNKDESYIIFEMAQKKNLSESNRFAKSVQDNLVKIAGRRDRGVHQAGFWVLWSTSMPSILVELDFICNPESAKFMTSKEGVDKLAEAIFQSIKVYEQNYLQKQRMIADGRLPQSSTQSNAQFGNDGIHNSNATSNSNASEYQAQESLLADVDTAKDYNENASSSANSGETRMVVGLAPESEARDMSHSGISTVKSQKKARTTADGRRRRSEKSKFISQERNLTVNNIVLKSETACEEVINIPEKSINTKPTLAKNAPSKNVKKKKGKNNAKSDKGVKAQKVETDYKTDNRSVAKSKREWITRVNEDARVHAGARKSLKSRTDKK